MILRFISGIWTTLAVQWLQVQKHRWVHDGNEIFGDNNTPPQGKANLKLWLGQSKQETESVISWRWLFLVSQAVVSYLWWEWKRVSVESFCVLQVLAKYSHIGVLCLGGNNDICFSQPVEDISVVSWNRQVQHILASANPSGKAVVWDLRKNEPIIKISDHSNRVGGLNTKLYSHFLKISFSWKPFSSVYNKSYLTYAHWHAAKQLCHFNMITY